MATRKQYGDPQTYEQKLKKVMDRLGVSEFDFDWTGKGYCFIEFRYKGELYRFEHSVEKAKSLGMNLQYGSDSFAQVVLALEDLARMVERGIYDLSTWVAGMKYLPPAIEIPSFLQFMGFDRIPDAAEVNERYRQLARQIHPDAGGSAEDFDKLKKASEQALKYLSERAR